MSSVELVAKEASDQDLQKITQCHVRAFPKTLSTRLGGRVSFRMLQWYMGHPKRFLLWIEKNDQCVGYAGGMVVDGTQTHGSASSVIQYAFKDFVLALLVRPWLWFHPELISRYRLILKNIYFKLSGYRKPMNQARNLVKVEPHVGLVVIGVHPDYLSKGYGSFLLQSFEQKVKDLGYEKMSLTVLSDNNKAIKSYSQNGWAVVKQKGKSVSMEKLIVL